MATKESSTMAERTLIPEVGEAQLPKQEWEFIKTKGISITSSPGGGSSTVASMLAERLQIPSERLLKVGDKRREFDEEIAGKHTEDVDHKDPIVERKTDQWTRSMLRQSSPETPSIIEGQLAGYVVSQEEEKARKNHRAIDKTIRILLVVDEKEGAKRVKEREEKKGRTGFSVEDWERINRKRHAKDLRNWKKAYTDLRGIDPHDGNSMERDGKTPLWKRFYDIKIDTTEPNPQQVTDQIIMTLWENGYIRKRQPQELQEGSPAYLSEV